MTALGTIGRAQAAEVISGLFERILGISAVADNDDFFRLGGDSLAATRLINEARLALGVDLTLADVFEEPSVAGLAGVVSELPLIEATSTRLGMPDRVPLSPGQRRLWFLNRLSTALPVYNVPYSWRLTGALDVAALHEALLDVLERHEVLRTVLPDGAPEPHQNVLEPRAVLPELKVVPVAPADVAEVQRGLEWQPFDLTIDPPLRAWLLRVADDEHVLVMSIHHVATDGMSMNRLARDLARCYAARLGGAAPGLAPLPMQYRDYTLWHDRLLGSWSSPGTPAQEQLGYWSRALRGLPVEVSFPPDRQRPARASYRGRRIEVEVGADVHRLVNALARRTSTTTFMVLNAALTALMTRLGAGSDIPIGTTSSGRYQGQFDESVGFFVNTLVMRTRTDGDPSFENLLQRVRATAVEAYRHRELPFEGLVEALNPPRSLARHPYFQVMLVLEDAEDEAPDLAGLEVRSAPTSHQVSRFDMAWNVVEKNTADGEPAGLTGFVEFSTDLFDEDTARRYADAFVHLLTVVARDPATPIASEELTHPSEREALRRWNATEQPLWDHTLVEAFERQADRTPDTVAVFDDADRLTYRELDERSNQLARLLRAEGAGPETVVALLLPRSTQAIVALIAVVKTGAAYMPVDPALPVARILFMLNDARPVCVVGAHLDGAIPPGLTILDPGSPEVLDRLRAVGAGPLTGTERPEIHDEHPVYVLFTSGSTGRPKGVVFPHRALINLSAWHIATLGRDAGPVTAQFASLSFDIASQEIMSALLSGRTLAIPSELTRRSPRELVRWMDQHAVSELHAPMPIIAGVCEEALDQGLELPGLVDVVQGGEPLVLSTAARRFLGQPRRRLHNHYGPTETHAITAATFDVGDESLPTSLPIGTPLWNFRVHVVDEQMCEVPVGVVGELVVSGLGVARGYLRRPGLTAARFVPDVFSTHGGRMYRTNDLVRRRGDGVLEFLGRSDFMVKLRGFRIELGEVESVLCETPGVAQAVVVVREDTPGDRRLVAYVVASPGDGVAPDTLGIRRAAARLLPEYMVPAVVLVDSLPLSTNGKVDRDSLPVPVLSGSGSEDLSGVAQKLRDLYAEILGVAEVGARDDFFLLGGHSLLATKLVNRVRDAFGVELSIASVFEHPNVVELAGVVERAHELAGRATLDGADR